MHDPQQGIRLKRLSYAVSVAVASLMASHAALAQDQNTADASSASQSTNVNVQNAGANNIATIVVSTRKSQQSSIERKKNAATALDSIVAEDVGALPDRNIGEAISRMAGIALDRGDF